MNAAPIQYIWQTVQESERSEEIQFMDDNFLIKAEATRLTQQRSMMPWQPGHRDTSAKESKSA